MRPGHSSEKERDLTALYALGALQGDELREFETALVANPELADEVASVSSVVGELGYAAAPQTPRQELRDRVLERIGAEGLTKEHPKLTKENQDFAGAAWLEWTPLFPGVEVKLLSADNERGYATTLVKMAPGATIPPHRHVEPEDSYVLEGEIVVSGVLMRPGDHCHAKPGSVHPVSTTTSGCVYIAVKSLRDEWLTVE
jgi:quercetin dioxygenase-like cupin family protein